MPKQPPRRTSRRNRQNVSIYTDSDPSLFSSASSPSNVSSIRTRNSKRINSSSIATSSPSLSSSTNQKHKLNSRRDSSSASLTTSKTKNNAKNNNVEAEKVEDENTKKEEEPVDEDEKWSVLPHRVACAPILPSLSVRNQKENSKSLSSSSKINSSVESFLKRHHGLKMWKKGLKLIPEWKEMRYNDFYHEQDYRTVKISQDIAIHDRGDNITINSIDVDKSIDQDKESCDKENSKIPHSRKKNRDHNSHINNEQCTEIQAKNKYNKNDQEEQISSSGSKSAQISRSIRVPPKLSDASYVTRSCTCMAMSPSPNNYLAIGDSAGYVNLYSIYPVTTSILRISTLASQRSYEEERQTESNKPTTKDTSTKAKATHSKRLQKTIKSNIRAQRTETKKHLRECFAHHPIVNKGERYLPIAASHAHAIEALSFSSFPTTNTSYEHSVLFVLSTKMEIEIHNLLLYTKKNEEKSNNCNDTDSKQSNSTLLWSINTAEQWRSGPAKRLSIHPTRGILASFFHAYPFPENIKCPPNFSPLAICGKDGHIKGIIPQTTKPDLDLQNENNVNNCRKTSPITLGIHAVGLWDIQSNGSYIFMSTPIERIIENHGQKDDTHQILKLDSTTYEIVHKTTIPVKTSRTNLLSTICQTPDGNYILASSTKGIRLYCTQTLNLIKIFGDSIALHGHVLLWQDCFLLTDYDYKNNTVLERVDELNYREEVEKNAACDKLKMFIVGIPHAFKEPEEMKDTIHFWQLNDFHYEEKKLPTYTLKIPQNSGGIHSLAWRHSKLILMTQRGDCHEMTECLYSDWSGKMYPPGFLVHEENVEYIENEDELDLVIEDEENWYAKEIPGIEYGIDMHIEQNVEDFMEYEENQLIDVCGREEDSELKIIPCHPETFLQEKIYDQLMNESLQNDDNLSDIGIEVNGYNSSANFIFPLLPTISDMPTLRQKGFEVQMKQESLSGDSEKAKSNRSKRLKGGAIEALKASVDKNLRFEMFQSQRWSSRQGNKKTKPDGPSPESICLACKGRMCIHTCGSRDIPVDHDLLAKQLQEKQRAEMKQKESERKAKKRALEEKRKEEKRKRKRAIEDEKKKLEMEKKAKEFEVKTKKAKRQAEIDERKKRKLIEDEERQMKKILEEERKQRKKLDEEERKLRKKMEEEQRKNRKRMEDEERKLRKKMEEKQRKLRKQLEDEKRKHKKYLLKQQKEEKKVAKKQALEGKRFAIKVAKVQRAIHKKNLQKAQQMSKDEIMTNCTRIASLIAHFSLGSSYEESYPNVSAFSLAKSDKLDMASQIDLNTPVPLTSLKDLQSKDCHAKIQSFPLKLSSSNAQNDLSSVSNSHKFNSSTCHTLTNGFEKTSAEAFFTIAQKAVISMDSEVKENQFQPKLPQSNAQNHAPNFSTFQTLHKDVSAEQNQPQSKFSLLVTASNSLKLMETEAKHQSFLSNIQNHKTPEFNQRPINAPTCHSMNEGTFTEKSQTDGNFFSTSTISEPLKTKDPKTNNMYLRPQSFHQHQMYQLNRDTLNENEPIESFQKSSHIVNYNGQFNITFDSKNSDLPGQTAVYMDERNHNQIPSQNMSTAQQFSSAISKIVKAAELPDKIQLSMSQPPPFYAQNERKNGYHEMPKYNVQGHMTNFQSNYVSQSYQAQWNQNQSIAQGNGHGNLQNNVNKVIRPPPKQNKKSKKSKSAAAQARPRYSNNQLYAINANLNFQRNQRKDIQHQQYSRHYPLHNTSGLPAPAPAPAPVHTAFQSSQMQVNGRVHQSYQHPNSQTSNMHHPVNSSTSHVHNNTAHLKTPATQYEHQPPVALAQASPINVPSNFPHAPHKNMNTAHSHFQMQNFQYQGHHSTKQNSSLPSNSTLNKQFPNNVSIITNTHQQQNSQCNQKSINHTINLEQAQK